jgi:hypothetical protein
MAAIYSNGGNRWNILGFNFTKRDALSSVYIKIYLWSKPDPIQCKRSLSLECVPAQVRGNNPWSSSQGIAKKFELS